MFRKILLTVAGIVVGFAVLVTVISTASLNIIEAQGYEHFKAIVGLVISGVGLVCLH